MVKLQRVTTKDSSLVEVSPSKCDLQKTDVKATRAVKACPWSMLFWNGRLHSLRMIAAVTTTKEGVRNSGKHIADVEQGITVIMSSSPARLKNASSDSSTTSYPKPFLRPIHWCTGRSNTKDTQCAYRARSF